MNNGWFTSLEEICLAEYDYLGLMTFSDMSGSDFTYWIGMFAESNTPVPDGYLAYDLPESDIAVAWVKGKEPEIYGKDEIVIKKFQEAELSKLRFDINGGGVSLERYNCPRFTTPDADGNVTLDYCYYIE
jgi:predicted transcriptional regulator YdeE